MIICSWHNCIVSKSSAQEKNILLELNQIHSSKSLKEEIKRKIAYTLPDVRSSDIVKFGILNYAKK